MEENNKLKETFIRLMYDPISISEIEKQMTEFFSLRKSPFDPHPSDYDETINNLKIFWKWYMYKLIVEDMKDPKLHDAYSFILEYYVKVFGEYSLIFIRPKSKHLAYFYHIAQREHKLKQFKHLRIKSDLATIAEYFSISIGKFIQYYYQAKKENPREFKLLNSILLEVKKLP